MKNKTIFRIAIFYLIAISLSNVFRFDLLELKDYFSTLPTWTKIFTTPLGAIGILLGSLISMYFLSQERQRIYFLVGSSQKWSILMALVPVIVMSIIGLKNGNDVNPHYYGFTISMGLLIYAIFEEFGWRGYMEDELKDMAEWKRVLIIAVLWYAWHLSFIYNTDILVNLKFFGLMLIASWGIGKVIQSTKSIISAGCFHMIYNALIFNTGATKETMGNDKFIIIGICIVLWLIIIKLWERETT